MQNIPLKLAAPGMVLAKEIKSPDNSSSMTICGKGVKMTESLIDRLSRMGVQSLIVEGHPVTLEGEATLDEMLTALDMRFSRANDDPLMLKIKEIYRKQLLRSMGESGG
jgi:GTPase